MEEIDHTNQNLPNNVFEQNFDRFKYIKPFLNKITDLDAVVGRGGPLKPLSGGTYRINKLMLKDYRRAKYANHASNLGAILADKIAQENNIPAFIVDPVTTDEFEDVARISGVPGVNRYSRSHALNIKYCVRKAESEIGEIQSKNNFVAAHLGSGFSIAAVRNGAIIDVNDALLGMGPFSIERAGALPLQGLINLIFSQKYEKDKIIHLLTKGSGFAGYLGTRDLREVEAKIETNSKYRLVYQAMIYQIVKEIGAMYAALAGDVRGLILTGGLVKSKSFTKKILDETAFIEDQFIYSGSFEAQALADGAYRILNGTEKAKEYK